MPGRLVCRLSTFIKGKIMSYLSIGTVTQFAATATCDFVSKKAKLEQGPLLCSVLSPGVQAAGNYVYQSALQDTSERATSFNHSSSLNSLEEAAAGTLGAYVGYQVLKSVGDATAVSYLRNYDFSKAKQVNTVKSNPLVQAGMVVIGTKLATN